MSDHIITHDAFNKLKEEMEYLSTIKRREIADRIQKAKDLGDLSENAEYTEAKESQAFNDGRIGEIQNILKNATVVDGGSDNKVNLGSRVTVKVNGGKKEYTIVSFTEAEPLDGKISNESPLGMALMNRKKGDKVSVNTPRGEMNYEILSIS